MLLHKRGRTGATAGTQERAAGKGTTQGMGQVETPVAQSPSQLRESIAVLRLRKWSILLIATAVAAAAIFFSVSQDAVYRSRARVLVKPVFGSSRTNTATQINLETERELATSTRVARLAIDSLGLEGVTPRELRENLTVGLIPNTEILTFEYEHPDPAEAQRYTQAFAQAYLQNRAEQAIDDLLTASQQVQQRIDLLNRELAGIEDDLRTESDPTERSNLQLRANVLTSQIAVLTQELSELTPSDNLKVGQVVEPAALPTTPANANPMVNGVLGLILGLGLGIGVAFLRERLDDRLRGHDDLEAHIAAPVLAVIPKVGEWKKKDQPLLVSATEPRSSAAESYRKLRTRLMYAATETGARTFLVTSAYAGEGKTAAVANLAVVLAQAGKSVIAISADLRKPRLHRFFNADNGTGLSNLLTANSRLQWRKVAIQPAPNLPFLLIPSGPVPANPAELLGSDAMGGLLAALRAEADFVLIDATPILAVADAITLAPLTDAVLFIADADSATRGAIAHARQQLDEVNAQLVGAVLNKFDPAKARAYPYYYRYYYAYRYEGHNQPKTYPVEVVVRGNGSGIEVSPPPIARGTRWGDNPPPRSGPPER